MEPAWALATSLRDERKLLLGIAERPNANPALAVVSQPERVGGDQKQPTRKIKLQTRKGGAGAQLS